jgi:hypothetical protein
MLCTQAYWLSAQRIFLDIINKSLSNKARYLQSQACHDSTADICLVLIVSFVIIWSQQNSSTINNKKSGIIFNIDILVWLYFLFSTPYIKKKMRSHRIETQSSIAMKKKNFLTVHASTIYCSIGLHVFCGSYISFPNQIFLFILLLDGNRCPGFGMV